MALKRSSSGQLFVRDEASPYVPFPTLQSRHAFQDITCAGRFRVPATFPDRLLLKIKAHFNNINIKLDSTVAESDSVGELAPTMPPQWQALLSFLEGKNISAGTAILTPCFNDEPKMFHMRIPFHVDEKITDGKSLDQFGSSAHLGFEEALSKAVGELLERRFLTVYRSSECMVAAAHELDSLKSIFLDPAKVAGFSEEQKAAHKNWQYDDTRKLRWVKGTRLTDGASAFLPAQFVFWNYRIGQDDTEPFLRESNTNGCAGGFTRDEAILSALREVVQRDAFLIHWLNGIPPRRISLASITDPDLQALFATLARYRFEVVLLDTTLDMPIPSCVAVIIDRSGAEPEIAMGGGAGFDIRDELKSAIFEGLAVRRGIRFGQQASILLDETTQNSPSSHHWRRIRAWGEKGSLGRIASFLSGEEISISEMCTSSFSSDREALQEIVMELGERGKEYIPYSYEVSNPMLSNIGYHVARVIVPALVPLYLHEYHPPLGAARLIEVPRSLHLTPGDLKAHISHPFP